MGIGPLDWILRAGKSLGAFPPHEFAYGTELDDISRLPAQVEQFLSLELFDPEKVKIDLSWLGRGGRTSTLDAYISTLAKLNPDIKPLMRILKQDERGRPAASAAVQIIRDLVEYRDPLRDKEKQDEGVLFIGYALKRPQQLDPAVRAAIEGMVGQYDTQDQLSKFQSQSCPKRFLGGNINIYPRLMENTGWYDLVSDELAGSRKPILEIRFMGLAGIFRYIVEEAHRRFGWKFFHLDGDWLEDYAD